MNPYIKMYLISEGDRKLLQLLRRSGHQPDRTATEGTPAIRLTTPRLHDHPPTDIGRDTDESEMDRMYERLQEMKYGETTSTPILPPPILKTPGVQIGHRSGCTTGDMPF